MGLSGIGLSVNRELSTRLYPPLSTLRIPPEARLEVQYKHQTPTVILLKEQ
jgi:hypothetical protein